MKRERLRERQRDRDREEWVKEGSEEYLFCMFLTPPPQNVIF